MARRLSLDVYVVTSAGLAPGRTHLDVGLAAIEGGANAVQLRAENPSEETRHAAKILVDRCRQSGVLFIVNNSIELAVEVGGDGVHLGQGDDPATARVRLGPEGVLGVSVEDPKQAGEAEEAGADYLGVTVWATATKPDARPVGIEGLVQVVSATRLPIVAIGGIDAGNAHRAMAAGAAGVAVVSFVGAAADPVAATQELVAAVKAFRSDGTL